MDKGPGLLKRSKRFVERLRKIQGSKTDGSDEE
jgi:hypothetical protein